MATITFDIADASLQRIINCTCITDNYEEFKKPGETKAAFTKRMGAQFYKSKVKQVEAQLAADAARAQVIAEIDSIVIS